MPWSHHHVLAHKYNHESSRWPYFTAPRAGISWQSNPELPREHQNLWMLLVAWWGMVSLAAQKKQWSWLYTCKHTTQSPHSLYGPKNRGRENTLQRKGEEAMRAQRKHLRHHRSDIPKSSSTLWPAFPRKVEHTGSLEIITFKSSETCSMMVYYIKELINSLKQNTESRSCAYKEWSWIQVKTLKNHRQGAIFSNSETIFKYLHFGFEMIKTCNSYPSGKIHTGEKTTLKKKLK